MKSSIHMYFKSQAKECKDNSKMFLLGIQVVPGSHTNVLSIKYVDIICKCLFLSFTLLTIFFITLVSDNIITLPAWIVYFK